MGLFNKKKEEKSCCCGSGCTPEKMAQAEAAKTTAGIKVLGAGCAKCHALEDATKAALAELNMDTTILRHTLLGTMRSGCLLYPEFPGSKSSVQTSQHRHDKRSDSM